MSQSQDAVLLEAEEATTDRPAVQVFPNTFAHLIEQNRARAFALAYRLLGNGPDAEDAVQEATLNAWKARGMYRGDGTFWVWFSSIVRNEAFDALRRRGREQRHCLEREKAQVQALLVPDSALNPDAVALERERDQELRALLGRLPEEFRTPLLLRYWEDWSYKEIAASLGLPLPTVKMRLWRGHQYVKALLANRSLKIRSCPRRKERQPH